MHLVDSRLVFVEDAELETAHLRAEQLRLALPIAQRLASLVEVTLDSLLKLLKSFFLGVFSLWGALILHHRFDLPLRRFLIGLFRLTAEVTLAGLLVATADLRDEEGLALAESLGKVTARFLLLFTAQIFYHS